ncbi:hypothetical protein GCM10029964_067350 [Kibdelosporangium lantanae]
MPVAPSVGSQEGKQSYASSNRMLRMITLSARTLRFTPRSVASWPTMVVLAPTGMITRACWLACERARASSIGPVTGAVPQVVGSYCLRYASRLYPGSAYWSHVTGRLRSSTLPLIVPVTWTIFGVSPAGP